MKKYARIFRYLKEYKRKIILYFIFILFSVLFSIISVGMLMPFLDLIFKGSGETSNLVLNNGNPVLQYIREYLLGIINSSSTPETGKIKALAYICVIIMLSIFFKNLFLYLSYYILNPIKNAVANTIRAEIYDKILQLPIGYFTEKRKGDLMSRVTNDLGEVETSVVGTLEGWVRDPLTIVINLVTLLVLSVQLTIFVLLLIPVMGFIIGRITRSLKKQSLEVAEKYGESVSILDETLGGLRVIKAFNVENILRGKFFNINNSLLIAKNKIGYRRDMASPMSEFLGVSIFCGILYFGGILVLDNHIMEASAFITYLALFYNIINPAKTLSTSFSNMQKGTAAIARIEEVLNAPVTVHDNPNGKSVNSFNHSIEFKNVGFAYDDFVILKNINLTVGKGKTVALVGSSGAGKSTLADLVPRFHDVSSGELLIDGVNIKDYSLRQLRELMGIVTQEPILFNDTIANNIALGKENATEKEIADAARIANAHSFIINKEDSYQTNIGDRGSKLSGGERQRLTIARAVLKNPPILILDEATSSLDTESERLVQDAINHLMQDRTSIVIAHRLSTVRHADEIIVLQKGEIAERGTHDELIAKGGIYNRLVELQEVK
ncbi:ABC transporter ATP-binding protein [Limnovirga soli]|uniref:ATP-binding cassette domain-containing protein n=1 Tax=Limnovirga soli TaxID=2656915 RepID=A0A8J8JWH2_9BACT|nr:ABC transporter ATP-binding protein [Limnovirga soli]NNV57739.1 ATP-binding cassette domain-containing protein [Limnovirga soli]